MIIKYKNIISLLLLMVFSFPSIVKLEHHHVHPLFSSESEKGINQLHERCNICSFEFSFFMSFVEFAGLQKEKPSDNYFITYNSPDNSCLTPFSFLLRAPPLRIRISAT
jgi:hypothetical protein